MKERLTKQSAALPCPGWFRPDGLADAEVLSVSVVTAPADRSVGVTGCRYLCIRLDAAQAMLDRDVRELRLYSPRVTEGGDDLDAFAGCWWFSDTLTPGVGTGKPYTLTVDFKSRAGARRLTVSFVRAEVIRGNAQ